MKKVLVRAMTGIVYIALILGAIFAHGWWFWSLAVLFGVLAVNEFTRISNNNFVSNSSRLLDIIGFVMFMLCASSLVSFNQALLSIGIFGVIAYFVVRFIMQLYIQDGNALSHLANSVMAQVYISLPLLAMLMIYFLPRCGEYMVLGMFIMIWLNDTGAFCVGSLCGKHKLFERISPKKTWEGFFGGLGFCVLASLIFYFFFPQTMAINIHNQPNLPACIGMGVLVSIFATWGDLIESLIKRSLGVKDSGSLLPGHGGILDRIDSLLLVAPVLLVYLIFCVVI